MSFVDSECWHMLLACCWLHAAAQTAVGLPSCLGAVVLLTAVGAALAALLYLKSDPAEPWHMLAACP